MQIIAVLSEKLLNTVRIVSAASLSENITLHNQWDFLSKYIKVQGKAATWS